MFDFDDPKWRAAMVQDLGILLSGLIEYRPIGAKEAHHNRSEAGTAGVLEFVAATVERFDVRGYRLILHSWHSEHGPFPFECCNGRVQLFSPLSCVRHVGKATEAQVTDVVELLEATVPHFADRLVEAIDPFLDDEGMAILCARVLPVLRSHATVTAARWQTKALRCASPRLLQLVVGMGLYDMGRNVSGYKKSDVLFHARSPLAIHMLVDEGHGAFCSRVRIAFHPIVSVLQM